MSVAQARTDLAEALTGDGWNTYAYPPAVVTPPAVILVPDEPYLELVNIGRGLVNVRARFRVTCAVAPLDNPSSLAQLERLIVGVMANVPDGAVVESASRPATTQVGPSDLLTSDLSVEVRASITPDPEPEPEPEPAPEPGPEE
jgi:hypothetical protein